MFIEIQIINWIVNIFSLYGYDLVCDLMFVYTLPWCSTKQCEDEAVNPSKDLSCTLNPLK